MGRALTHGPRRRGAAERVPGVAAPSAPRASGLAALGVALAAGLLGAVVFRGAMGYGFSQDDFLGLARASGAAPRLPLGWRVLSHQWFWDVVVRVFSMRAAPAHALQLALHGATTTTLAWLLSRRVGAPAALAGAAFFGTHAALFTTGYWLAANGDVVATLFALLVTAAFLGTGTRPWWALPAFVLSLAAKESTIALPLVLMAFPFAWPQRGTPRTPGRDPIAWSLVALALAWALLFRAVGSRAALGDAAYAQDAHAIAGNLLTYAGWTSNAWLPTVRSVGDAVAPGVFGWGAALLVAWTAAAFLRPTRARGAAAALVAYLLLLAPVLPLAAHTYHYYLYAALPAAGWLVAALADAALARARPAVAWGIAGALAVLFTVNGAALVARIEHAPFTRPELRSDPTVDRARIATAALDDLRAARLPGHTRLVLWSPQSQAMARAAGADPARETYDESNVRAALLDGLALRVMVPAIDSVAFVRTFDPRDSTALWGVYRYDGHLRTLSAAELARLLASGAPR